MLKVCVVPRLQHLYLCCMACLYSCEMVPWTTRYYELCTFRSTCLNDWWIIRRMRNTFNSRVVEFRSVKMRSNPHMRNVFKIQICISFLTYTCGGWLVRLKSGFIFQNKLRTSEVEGVVNKLSSPLRGHEMSPVLGQSKLKALEMLYLLLKGTEYCHTGSLPIRHLGPSALAPEASRKR